jgi:hypothetical protein
MSADPRSSDRSSRWEFMTLMPWADLVRAPGNQWLRQPLTVIWRNSDEARSRLGDWFDKSVDTLSGGGGHPVLVRLE